MNDKFDDEADAVAADLADVEAGETGEQVAAELAAPTHSIHIEEGS